MAYLVIDLESLRPEQIAPLLTVIDGAGARVIGCLSGGDPSRDRSSVHCQAIIEKYKQKPEIEEGKDVPISFVEYQAALNIKWIERREIPAEVTLDLGIEDCPKSSKIPSGWVVNCYAEAKRNWKRTIIINNELFGLKLEIKYEHWLAGICAASSNWDYRDYAGRLNPIATQKSPKEFIGKRNFIKHNNVENDSLTGVMHDYSVLLAKSLPSWNDLSGILTKDIASLGPQYFLELVTTVEMEMRRLAWEDPTNRLVRKIVSLKKEIAQLKGIPFVDEGEG